MSRYLEPAFPKSTASEKFSPLGTILAPIGIRFSPAFAFPVDLPAAVTAPFLPSLKLPQQLPAAILLREPTSGACAILGNPSSEKAFGLLLWVGLTGMSKKEASAPALAHTCCVTEKKASKGEGGA